MTHRALLVVVVLGAALVDARYLQFGRENLDVEAAVQATSGGQQTSSLGSAGAAEIAPVTADFSAAEVSEDEWSDAATRRLLQSGRCSGLYFGCRTCKTMRVTNSTGNGNGNGKGNGNGGGKGKTILVCSTCQTGFTLFRDTFPPACNCGAGLFNNGTACTSCPRGKFCTGAKTGGSGTAVESCPNGLTTYIDGAKSMSQCLTTGGYGRVAKRDPSSGLVTYESVLCPKGTFNGGKNSAGCSKCGTGLTTDSTGSDSVGKCGAPKGSYMKNGVAVKCPKGTYAPGFGNQTVCNACADGTTTSVTEGGDATTSCDRATRGRYWDPVTRQGVPCRLNTYMDTETDATDCKPCPGFWRTETPGAEGPASCVAPPGMELVANATYNATNLTLCEIGWYKEGWNRNPCLKCGIGLKTLEPGATIKDECFIPAGWGMDPESIKVEGRVLEAKPCKKNTYGWNTRIYNIKTGTCNPCRAKLFTLDVLNGTETSGWQDESACLLAPGYGMDPTGEVEMCREGTWSTGYHRDPCTSCPQGYTTLATGATSKADCVVIPGWMYDTTTATVKPCDKGSYSLGGTAENPGANCTLCPSAWTTQTQESDKAEDCNVCVEGYGDNNGAGCEKCGYDTYSEGGALDSCKACQGTQTSMRGAWQAQQCVPRFPLIDTSTPVYIPANEDTWTDTPAGAGSEAECRSECNTAGDCIMYRFKTAGGAACSLLLSSDPALTGRAAIGFKAFAQGAAVDYSFSYVAGDNIIGVLISNVGTGLSLEACTAACNNDENCMLVRLTGDAANGYTCATYRGDLDAEWVSVYRIKGQNLLGDGFVVSTV